MGQVLKTKLFISYANNKYADQYLCYFAAQIAVSLIGSIKMSRNMTKPTMWLCAPGKTRSAWASAQFSLCAQWVAMDPSFLHADSEDSDQTGRMLSEHSFCWFCHAVAQILTYCMRGSWVYLPYLFTSCVSRSCDLLARFIQTCIGST